jgi:hypothetical protein
MRGAALFALLASTAAFRPSLPRSLLHPSHSPGSSIRYRKAMSSWSESPSSVPSSTRTFSPVDFGGDPTGVANSTAAIAAAVSALLNASHTAGVRDANGILDCGGAILDLQGGEYLTSSPLVIPAYYGNLEVRAGTLRASASFPVDRFLVEVGRGGQLDGNNVDVSLSGLFLDASQVALGCINATGLFGGVIGPQIYAFNFTGVGIEVLSGHEVTVMQTWVGEYWWSDKRKENGTASTAVGIRVDGNDHIVDDVIVFSSHPRGPRGASRASRSPTPSSCAAAASSSSTRTRPAPLTPTASSSTAPSSSSPTATSPASTRWRPSGSGAGRSRT